MPSRTGKETPDLQFFNVVDGKIQPAKEHHQVIDPRTEEPLWDAPIASSQDLDDAVEAARRAFKTWKKTMVAERQAKITEVARCIGDNKKLLSEILMRETGKPQVMAENEIDRTIVHFEYYSTLFPPFFLSVPWST